MELRVLRYFLTVVREEGINKAAESLHITQPTLSRQLSRLEAELGVKLFARGAKKITLTSEGLLLRRRAEEILTLADKTQRELMEQEQQLEGRITIGAGELASVRTLQQLIGAFHKKHPLVTYDILTESADVVKEQMEKGLVDLGILLEPVDMERFDFLRLEQTEHWVAVMRPEDPLAAKESVKPSDLAGRPLILPRRLNVQNKLSSWFGPHFEASQVLFTSNLTTNAAVMVQGGLGYSIVVEGTLPLWDKTQITYRPLSPELTASCVIAWKKQQPFSLAAERFIEHVKRSFGIIDTVSIDDAFDDFFDFD